jgi:hypothetical protein
MRIRLLTIALLFDDGLVVLVNISNQLISIYQLDMVAVANSFAEGVK